ncbi:MAG: metal ABC transporter substrate-binding protein [Opitutus sp.]|nr:metal ABC transporter substrate-binding protein [Opitutus sp.]MCS6248710.1 metal ABC transporter substrate-binding protein [Opitutus sp.]MCS6274213.1 metal ABC transporter substrate-binding protein [Opitutus sp.]MCS6277114.1 metal ABC transporter substrate-binding protein [Opitutus sp.]MCS6300236.1 metal ABC transporter substrate-binding protein [Opitutus sp.]
MTFKFIRSFVAAVTILGGINGGGFTHAAHAAPATSATPERPRVLTTFTILADMARNVAGDYAEVESLTKPGAEIHGYEPTPRDIVKTQRASLVLWNGMNLERWFEPFFANVKNVPQVVLTEGIEPMGITEGPYTGKPNPHAWMSPMNAVRYVENIRAALARIDPAHAADYAANAEAYSAKIRALDAPVRAQLARIPEAQRWLVTSEGAFSYLCRDYGLRPLYLWPINADAQGTPQQIRAVIDQVRAHRIPVVFSESTVSEKPARQVAKEGGARYGGVLYVDSLTTADGPAPTYLALLQANATTIVNAFSASAAP